MNRWLVIVVALLGLAILRAEDQGGCDSTIVGDPTFDLWCGKTLCAWTVEQGEIRRVSTWHRSDYGAELVGDPVVLSQVAKGGLGSCLELRVQADHEDGVNLFLELDFFNDKTVDHSIPMGSDDYRPVIHHLVPPAADVDPVRFVVRKAGSGRAVLAEIKVKTVTSSDCVGLARLELRDLQGGTPCTSASECTGKHCDEVLQFWLHKTKLTEHVCGSCDVGGYCPSGKTCGLSWPTSGLPHQACVPGGAKLLGERCVAAGECQSGICCEDVCSECCAGDDAACATDQSCARRSWVSLGSSYDFEDQLLPHQCSPGGKKGKAGAACLTDSDCASNSCKGSGELKVCRLSGRTCTKDADCPDKCLTLGQAGGACQ